MWGFKNKEARVLQGLWPIGLVWAARFRVAALHPSSLAFTSVPLGAADPSLLRRADWSASHFQVGFLNRSQPLYLGPSLCWPLTLG